MPKTIDITSEFAANVWKVVAKVGDRVDSDSVLVILESMKMEIPVSPDQAGDLIEVTVQEGETIVEGQLLARVSVG